MKTIWKYPLRVTDKQEVVLPEGASILSVGLQYGRPVLWALVDPQSPDETRTILMRGTGHPADDAEGARFIGTIFPEEGRLVFHLFEKGGQA